MEKAEGVDLKIETGFSQRRKGREGKRKGIKNNALLLKNADDIHGFLKPLFDIYQVPMVPASETSLNLFTERATEREVPDYVIAQLTDFYSIVDGVPCLDSLAIHPCADLIIFEWWDQQGLWLGQRDFYSLRWSKDRYCIGDASNISYSPSHEHQTFAEALGHLVKMYETPGDA